jgi:hypothetical protein
MKSNGEVGCGMYSCLACAPMKEKSFVTLVEVSKI